jgi:hypothetical protein
MLLPRDESREELDGKDAGDGRSNPHMRRDSAHARTRRASSPGARRRQSSVTVNSCGGVAARFSENDRDLVRTRPAFPDPRLRRELSSVHWNCTASGYGAAPASTSMVERQATTRPRHLVRDALTRSRKRAGPARCEPLRATFAARCPRVADRGAARGLPHNRTRASHDEGNDPARKGSHEHSDEPAHRCESCREKGWSLARTPRSGGEQGESMSAVLPRGASGPGIPYSGR